MTVKTLLDGAQRFGGEIEVVALEAEAALGGTFKAGEDSARCH